MAKPTLHMLGIFHTITSQAYSHCAFTGKVLRFPKMIRPHGWNIIEYSNGVPESNPTQHVQILSESELHALSPNTVFHGDAAKVGSQLHKAFEAKLIPALQARIKKHDIILHPFGYAHQAAVTKAFPDAYHVESGIGYPTAFADYRIYESSQWMHWHLGKMNREQGFNYWHVIPNYFEVNDWDVCLEPDMNRVAFMGRVYSEKGVATIAELAKHMPKYQFELAGQGSLEIPKPPVPSIDNLAMQWAAAFAKDHKDVPTSAETMDDLRVFLAKKVVDQKQASKQPTRYWNDGKPNMKHIGSLIGRERSPHIGNARCAVMPTVFIEPFGGSGVEAMLCGTPLLTTAYGAFCETVQHGVNGFRCHTLGDWMAAIEASASLDRAKIARDARAKYSLEACGILYDQVFRDIADLPGPGWFSKHSNRIH